MAVKPFWRGYLKLSLVNCAVAMTPATTDSEKLRFHTVNGATGNRVKSQFVDSVTQKVVREEDEVKGYPRDEDHYVILEEDELQAVALESVRTIDIETFVSAGSIEWIWYDKPHYLTPRDKIGEEAFAVIRDAMKATATVGIARLVLYRREHAVLLQPFGDGIVLWTLHYGEEVRNNDDYFGGMAHSSADPEAVQLINKLIDKKIRAWDPEMVKDPVQERLADLIAQRKKRQKKVAKKKAAEPKPSASNVISIIDILKKSLAAEKK